jgi:hypothetical protein
MARVWPLPLTKSGGSCKSGKGLATSWWISSTTDFGRRRISPPALSRLLYALAAIETGLFLVAYGLRLLARRNPTSDDSVPRRT